MRGGFVACLQASDGSPPPLERAAAALRWHTGEPSSGRHGRLWIACLADAVHGPAVEVRNGVLFLAHGTQPESLESLRLRDRFAGIESDGTSLRAIRDALGEVPLFYRRLGEELWLATEIHPLLAVAPAAPDLEWLAAFSAMAEPPERTGWLGIERVLPGEILSVDASLHATSERWFVPPQQAGSGLSFADAAQRLRELFSNAVAERTSEHCGVLLSGGLDSSAVAVVAAQGSRPTLLTLSHPGVPDVDETRYARAVAEAAGLPLTVLEVEPDPWDPAGDIDAFGTPPLGAPTGMYAQAFRAFVERGCDAVLDGHDGDGVLGNLYAWSGNTLLDRRLDRLVAATREHGPRLILRELAKDLFPPSVAGRMWPPAGAPLGRESFRPYFRGATAVRLEDDVRWHPPRSGWRRAQLRALLPPTTQHFEETEMVAARFGIDIRHPFADRTLVDFLITLPHVVKAPTTQLKPLLREALSDLLPQIVVRRSDKTHFAPVVDARVDFDSCYRLIRDCALRLPDVDYGRLFRDAARPVNDRMLWARLTSAHAFLAAAHS